MRDGDGDVEAYVGCVGFALGCAALEGSGLALLFVLSGACERGVWEGA